MKKLRELRLQRKGLADEGEAILAAADSDGDRALTDEERQKLGEITDEVKALTPEIEQREAFQEDVRTRAGQASGEEIEQGQVGLEETPPENRFETMGDFFTAVQDAGSPGGHR